jgi:DNA adenine methylase
MTFKFSPNDSGNPPGKLADAELHFGDGPLGGLKLVGFAVWERRSGGRYVTLPARKYSLNGERRSFALLRPTGDNASQDRLREAILDAYREHEAALCPIWEPHRRRRYVEPFCGGLAMALGLRPKRGLLNDANQHLINFCRWLQRGLVLRIPFENSEDLYYGHRARFNALVAGGKGDGQEAAALFYYLNRPGYNGLCRFNRDGRFNVPFGRYAAIRYQRDFTLYRHVLENWTFSSGDFEAVAIQPDDFIYADPPYDVEFTQYARDRFRWADQERVAAWLARHAGPVILVNQASARVERLYRQLGFSVAFIDAPRRISCTGDRSPAREVIATRNL